ncbi:hypothetical protein, partial [Psychroflexus sp. MES1-P1E]|uniref:hypothetical protein n=1 Tax=Psychroflexus sp. MES1-P1E TaxID=2058320 RepID=UPI000CBCB2C4
KSESKYGLEDNKRTGAYAIGILIGFNIMSIITIIAALSIEKTPILEDTLLFLNIITILVSLFYSFYFFEKKKHTYIFEKYQNESFKKKKIRNIYVTLYIILSVALLYFAVYVGRENWIIEN